MRFVSIQKRLSLEATAHWIAFFLAASLFAIPLSSTAKSIFIVIAMVLIIASPEHRQRLSSLLSVSWCQAAIALFLMAVLASIWSPASVYERVMAIEKYSKLLYLPVLAVGFQDPRARRLGCYGFLAAMVLTSFASILAFIGLIPLQDAEPGGLFRNHIMTGYMMAFAAYLAAFLAVSTTARSARLIYALLALLFSFHVLFINNGRTGYVVYVLLMLLFMIQSFSWRKAVFGGVFGCLLIGLTASVSPVMRTAIEVAVNDCRLYVDNKKDTSLGYRLQFHDYARALLKRHPLFGNGTASFTHLYHQENPIPSRGDRLLEPHSQYWLVASEFGLLGVVILLGFFGSLWMASQNLATLKPLAVAVLLPFVVGNASDSLLFYSGTGYFFILFMALCLGEYRGFDGKPS